MTFVLIFLGTMNLLASSKAFANDYSIWSGAVRGDVRAVGMAGAATGLADDYFGAVSNPAGPALTLEDFDLQLSSSTIHDTYHFNSGTDFSNLAMGVAFNFEDSGLSVGYANPFDSVSPTGEQIGVREYRATGSFLLLEDHLALGLGLADAQLFESGLTHQQLRGNVGALYRFPDRFIVGISYSPGTHFAPDSQGRVFTLPDLLSVGLSWITNRTFRVASSFDFYGPEADVVNFHSPNLWVTTHPSVQAHLGMAYQILEYKHFYTNLFAGSYFENSRTLAEGRLHFTGGLEMQPWFMNFSVGIDQAPGYQNFIVDVGADVQELLRVLNLYPKEVPPPPAGVFPKPFEINEDWMPARLQDHPEDAFHTIDPEASDFQKTILK